MHGDQTTDENFNSADGFYRQSVDNDNPDSVFGG